MEKEEQITKTCVTGYPRIGAQRELKFACEKYFAGEISESQLRCVADDLKKSAWITQKNDGIDFISSNDFSFYDGMLDTAFMLGAVPERYRALCLSKLDTYFAMARGYQNGESDVKALPMKKWFNTNYHYIVPELDDKTVLCPDFSKITEEYNAAMDAGVETKINVVGPYTFLKLCTFTGVKTLKDFVEPVTAIYSSLIKEVEKIGAKWIQIEEPALVLDTSAEDNAFFAGIYRKILAEKSASDGIKVILSTYFGDIRDSYRNVVSLNFDGVALDFIEGKETLSLIKENGFPEDKILFAGLVNGKNIWKNNFANTVQLVQVIKSLTKAPVAVSTSCSLLHVPYTIRNEIKLSSDILKYFSFAREKLFELADLSKIIDGKDIQNNAFNHNQDLFRTERVAKDEVLHNRLSKLSAKDFKRLPESAERKVIQNRILNLPAFPTTTIGSFPQTKDVRQNRSLFKKGEITLDAYRDFNKKKIEECIRLQEELGLDVLVHGEFERNDMVEYFGENLDGYIFTEKAWVQSYGTRCVKPPVIWGDIKRKNPITVYWSEYAQSLTEKPVKGMLTGPVTILNWSFPREDISLKESAWQIALAIREEVLDLEKAGIKIIQIDEAALKEKLPLRKADWHSEYLEWAIPAFNLVHSGVKPETQIHTHMCYSEFIPIITDIDSMDADVITFEASRSNLEILEALMVNNFKTQVGPGVYDIHSPRVPSVQEIADAVKKIRGFIPKENIWINPDCGLKTRGEKETVESLKNLVTAARQVRAAV